MLKKQIESGRMLRVSAVTPRFHTTEDGRWDYRVTIVFKNVEAAFAPASVEEAIKKELFPDQDTSTRGRTPVRDPSGPLGRAHR